VNIIFEKGGIIADNVRLSPKGFDKVKLRESEAALCNDPDADAWIAQFNKWVEGGF
jgi:hypothetical protein